MQSGPLPCSIQVFMSDVWHCDIHCHTSALTGEYGHVDVGAARACQAASSVSGRSRRMLQRHRRVATEPVQCGSGRQQTRQHRYLAIYELRGSLLPMNRTAPNSQC